MAQCCWREHNVIIITFLIRQKEAFLERGLGVFRFLPSASLLFAINILLGAFPTLSSPRLLKFLSYFSVAHKQKWSFITKQYFFL